MSGRRGVGSIDLEPPVVDPGHIPCAKDDIPQVPGYTWTWCWIDEIKV